ncbi:putative proteasome subunit beta type-6 [Astathelohania contejeani]|uniref:Proteasome subunit beta type-6 n=1 Tax=Astathelohania contejeani TaxID=164912 RepID=A0ABQ7HXY0_9MICR|nr:putative proteasome subunit beta type-6 [Thelohania contejeani]
MKTTNLKMNKEVSSSFNPYSDNSGTSLAFKQANYILVASDTRHSSEMGINSRETSKIYKLGNFVLSTSGFHADGYDIYIKMMYELRNYESTNGKEMDIHSAARLLSITLYSKRFFPYYSYCCLSGFDGDTPVLYSYDPVGSYQSVDCRCTGSGAPMIQPLLDSIISKKNWENCTVGPLEHEGAIQLVKKAFVAASERDVKTGDHLEIYLITKDECTREIYNLRFD